MGWNEDRKREIKKQMKSQSRSLEHNIRKERWMTVRMNLIDLKYMLNELESMEEEE